jgi:hypothetical protein
MGGIAEIAWMTWRGTDFRWKWILTLDWIDRFYPTDLYTHPPSQELGKGRGGYCHERRARACDFHFLELI